MKKKADNETRTTVRAWVTKYALTKGIQEVVGDVDNGYLYYGGMLRVQVGPKDWFRTHEDAVIRAEALRRAKVRSLQEQLDKLSTMRFT